MAELPEYVGDPPNLSGSEEVVAEAVRAGRERLVYDGRHVRLGDIDSAFAVGLHMHQPLIPAGGGDPRAAAVVSNLRFMMDHPEVPDAHNAPVFLWCYRRMGEFFQKYDLLVTPGAPTAAFDVNLRAPETIAGKKPENYMAGSTVNSVITVSTCPAIAVPCGFDQYGRPVGLQLVGKPRGEAALLQAAVLYEKLVGLDKLLPIDPKPGSVPPFS